jgi:hypothetical protein
MMQYHCFPGGSGVRSLSRVPSKLSITAAHTDHARQYGERGPTDTDIRTSDTTRHHLDLHFAASGIPPLYVANLDEADAFSGLDQWFHRYTVPQ